MRSIDCTISNLILARCRCVSFRYDHREYSRLSIAGPVSHLASCRACRISFTSMRGALISFEITHVYFLAAPVASGEQLRRSVLMVDKYGGTLTLHGIMHEFSPFPQVSLASARYHGIH